MLHRWWDATVTESKWHQHSLLHSQLVVGAKVVSIVLSGTQKVSVMENKMKCILTGLCDQQAASSSTHFVIKYCNQERRAIIQQDEVRTPT